MGHDGSHANGGGQVAVAFNNTGQGWWNEAAAAASIRKGDEAGGGGARESTVVVASAVRRLTPRECERLRSEEHTSELQSLMRISYAVFCLKQTNNPPSIIYSQTT